MEPVRLGSEIWDGITGPTQAIYSLVSGGAQSFNQATPYEPARTCYQQSPHSYATNNLTHSFAISTRVLPQQTILSRLGLRSNPRIPRALTSPNAAPPVCLLPIQSRPDRSFLIPLLGSSDLCCPTMVKWIPARRTTIHAATRKPRPSPFDQPSPTSYLVDTVYEDSRMLLSSFRAAFSPPYISSTI